jgi:hypothetical protein
MTRCFGSLTQERNELGKEICANIDCGAELTGFDLTKHQRFCRNCRIKNKTMRWRCRGCQGIIYETVNRASRQYCDECKIAGIG